MTARGDKVAELRLAELEDFIAEHGAGALDVAALLRLGGELLVVATDRPAVDDLTADGFTGRRLRDEDGFARLVAVPDEGEPDRSLAWGGAGVIWRAVTPVVWKLARTELPREFGAAGGAAFLAVIRPPLAYWLTGKATPGVRFKLSHRKGTGLVVEVEADDGVRLGMSATGGLR